MARKKISTRSAGRIGKQIDELIGYVPTKPKKFDVDAKPSGRGGKPGVKTGDTGTYGDLTKRSNPNDGLQIDHMPSNASNLKRARDAKGGGDLSKAEQRRIRDQGRAMVVPDKVHHKSRTYGGRNNPNQIAQDAADPHAAIDKDLAKNRESLIDAGHDPAQVDEMIERYRKFGKEAL